jgi:hypothetical protein
VPSAKATVRVSVKAPLALEVKLKVVADFGGAGGGDRQRGAAERVAA